VEQDFCSEVEMKMMMITKTRWWQGVLASVMVFAGIGSGNAEDWAQWRGPRRDGISSETGLLAKWPEDGPKLVWQVKDLGNGYSTPSVADGRVYLLRNKDIDNEEVIALSATDGKLIWSTRIGSVGANRGPQYPAARSTPTIDGDKLYALGSNGDFACLETATGKVVWSKSFRDDFAGAPGSWAYAESPLVDGDLVISSPGGASATVLALNKSDGSVAWQAPLDMGDEASYSSPVACTIHGVKQYVLFLQKGVVGLDAGTGKMLWRYEGTAQGSPANVATPVVNGPFVYTGASRSQGGLVEIDATGNAKEVYSDKTLPTGMGGSVLVDGHLYGTGGQTMMCVEFASGKVVWQDRGIGAASVCYADGRLYLHGDNNDIAMVAASPAGFELISRFTPPNAPERGNSKAWTYPVIANGKLFVRDMGTVWCFDIGG
jgi:outer membrane protein assembly factor BamB